MKSIKKEVIKGRRGYVLIRYSNPNSDYRHLLFIASATMTLMTNLWLVVCATISAAAQDQIEKSDDWSGESAETVSFLCKCGYVANNAEAYCPVCGSSVSSYVYRISK